MSVIHNTNFNIYITDETLCVFDKYRQINTEQNESCGILIGTHSIDESRITITFATEPDSNDKRSRFSFKIRSNRHNKTLQNRFSKSGNREVYLGTWHTHPEIIPTPSACDIKDWMKQFKKNKDIFEIMIFLIVGIESTKYWMVKNGILYQIKNTDIKKGARLNEI